jgi:hypothetical protein
MFFMFGVALRPSLMLVVGVLYRRGMLFLVPAPPLRHHMALSHLLEMEAPPMVWHRDLYHF